MSGNDLSEMSSPGLPSAAPEVVKRGRGRPPGSKTGRPSEEKSNGENGNSGGGGDGSGFCDEDQNPSATDLVAESLLQRSGEALGLTANSNLESSKSMNFESDGSSTVTGHPAANMPTGPDSPQGQLPSQAPDQSAGQSTGSPVAAAAPDVATSTPSGMPSVASTIPVTATAGTDAGPSLTAIERAELQVSAVILSPVATALFGVICEILDRVNYSIIFRKFRLLPGIHEADVWRAMQLIASKSTREKHGSIQVAASASVSALRTNGRGIDFGGLPQINSDELGKHFVRKVTPAARKSGLPGA